MALRERAMIGHAVELPEPWCSAALTVVLPTYNEAANLPIIVAELFGLPLPGLHILVADDNSPDGTGAVADELAEKYGDRLTVLHRPGKQGLGVHLLHGTEDHPKDLRRQAHGRLVEDHDGRVQHEAPGELHQPLLAP